MKSGRTARRHFHSVGKRDVKVFMGNFSKLRHKTRAATKPVSSTKCVTESGNTNEREPTAAFWKEELGKARDSQGTQVQQCTRGSQPPRGLSLSPSFSCSFSKPSSVEEALGAPRRRSAKQIPGQPNERPRPTVPVAVRGSDPQLGCRVLSAPGASQDGPGSSAGW